MFGFHFLENFDCPYSSRSVTEFWRRWHISLSRWFRDYLYIPLGGNRRVAAAHLLQPGRRVLPLRAVARRELDLRRLGRCSTGCCSSSSARAGARVLARLPAGAAARQYAALVVMVGWVFFRADSLVSTRSRSSGRSAARSSGERPRSSRSCRWPRRRWSLALTVAAPRLHARCWPPRRRWRSARGDRWRAVRGLGQATRDGALLLVLSMIQVGLRHLQSVHLLRF